MSFDKTIPMAVTEYKVYNVDTTDELEKVASDDNIDFPDGFVMEPDFLYMWVRIVSAGEYYGSNNNADYFPEDDLVEYWETFKSGHAFKDHKNKSVADAIGKIISVRWNDDMKCVEILKGIDTKRAPETARGYAKGYLDSVSMGCRVPYTVCSICGNKARVRSEFCDHVRKYRNRYLSNGERVYEINHKPKFHDSSTVLIGAERVAKAFYVMNPDTYVESAFRKAASDGHVDHFIRISEQEMNKVATYQQTLHPLLQDSIEKVATDSEMMRKIAELEKELTGRLVNIMSEQDTDSVTGKNRMLEIIKFLTEKRMDESTLKNIAHSVKEIANENGVPTSRAFSALIGIAELMGIEFFPTELHTLLTHLTDAKLNSSLSTSDGEGDSLLPTEFAKGMNEVVIRMEGVKKFDDPGSLLGMYDEAAHRTSELNDDPLSFLESLGETDDLSHEPPRRMVRVIRKVLSPLMPARSYMPEHLYPRLSVVLAKHRPVIGSSDVRRDFDMLASPQSLGDLLGALAYNSYERARPNLIGTRMIKMALEADDFMEKKAEATPHIGYVGRPKKPGIGLVPMALGAVPAAYAASAYQKSRRENGRYLSDGENFIADKPGVVAGGAVLAGVPLSRKLAKVAPKAKEVLKAPFLKESSEYQFEGLVKVADSLHSGSFNAFDDNEVLKRYMGKTAASGEEASAVKMATLFKVGGMDKAAYELMNFYNIPNQEIGNFLKVAAGYVDEEMSKAAEDFTNNMILSVIGDSNPLSRSLPGRAVDAFIFKKLGEIGQTPPKEQGQPKLPKIEGGQPV